MHKLCAVCTGRCEAMFRFDASSSLYQQVIQTIKSSPVLVTETILSSGEFRRNRPHGEVAKHVLAMSDHHLACTAGTQLGPAAGTHG